MKAPGKEKHEKKMMHIPESLEICATGFLDGGEDHCHERDEHDVACCSWSRAEVCEEETYDAGFSGYGEAGKVYPVGDGVDPGKEDD